LSCSDGVPTKGVQSGSRGAAYVLGMERGSKSLSGLGSLGVTAGARKPGSVVLREKGLDSKECMARKALDDS